MRDPFRASLGRRLLPPLALCLPSLVFFAPLLFRSDRVLGAHDFPLWFRNATEASRTLLEQGEWPLWDPGFAGGRPKIADLQSLLFYPPYALVLLAPTPAVLAHFYLAHLLFGALGAYACFRRFGLRVGAAWIGAAAYGSTGRLLECVGVAGALSHVAAAAWLPSATLALERLLAAPSAMRAAPFAAALAATFLCGAPQLFLYAGFLLGLYALVRGRGADGGGLRGRASASWLFAGSLAWACALVAIQAIPAIEFVDRTPRAEGLPLDYASRHALTLRGLLSLVLPNFFEETYYDPQGAYRPLWEWRAYAGAAPAILAAAGLGLARDRRRLAFAGAGLLFLLYALGDSGGLFALLHREFSPLAVFRYPGRALVPLGFCLAALCAFGAEEVARRCGSEARVGLRRFSWGAAGAGATIAIAGGWIAAAGPESLREVRARDLAGFLLFGSAAVAAIASASRAGARPRGPLLGLGLATALDLVAFGTGAAVGPHRLTTLAKDDFLANGEILEEVKADPEGGRVFETSLLLGDHLYAWKGVENALVNVDLEPTISRDFLQFAWPYYKALGSVTNRAVPLAPARLLHVRFVLLLDLLAIPELEDLGPREVVIVRYGGDAVPRRSVVEARLHRLRRPLPRAFLAPRARVVPDRDRVIPTLARTDPAREAIVEEERFGLEGGWAGIARVLSRTANALVVETESDGPSFLFTSEVWDPGWKARLDGNPAEIARTNFLFRGLPLPPGRHRVEFEFLPRSFLLGAAISVGSLLALVAVLGRALRRRPRPFHAGKAA